MKLFTAVLSTLFTIVACQQPDDRDADQKELDSMLYEIQSLSTSIECTDTKAWTYVAYGQKACGGPIGFIAYSTLIDTNYFLSLIDQYTKKMKSFNEKYNVVSDCSFPNSPSGVKCTDGKPELVYN